MNFDEWMSAVNTVSIRRVGMGVRELVDATWRDWFDDGLTPEDAFQTYLDNDCDDLLRMFPNAVME